MCYDYHFGNLKQIYHRYVCVSIPNPIKAEDAKLFSTLDSSFIIHIRPVFFNSIFLIQIVVVKNTQKLGSEFISVLLGNTLRVYHQYTVLRICIFFIFLEASKGSRFQKLFRLVNLHLFFYPFYPFSLVCCFDEILCICQYFDN